MLFPATRHALLIALLPACFSPAPEVGFDATETDGDDTETDGDTDDMAETDDAESTGEPADGTELLVNGSFESWSSGMPASWSDGDATLELVEDGVDGDNAVIVRSAIYNSMGQLVQMPLPAGSCLALDLSTRYESGATDAPVVQLLGTDATDTDFPLFADVSWGGDGEWRTTSTTFVNSEDWVAFRLHVLASAPVEQAFAVDGVSLRLVECD